MLYYHPNFVPQTKLFRILTFVLVQQQSANELMPMGCFDARSSERPRLTRKEKKARESMDVKKSGLRSSIFDSAHHNQSSLGFFPLLLGISKSILI